MTRGYGASEFLDLHMETRRIWDANAEWWDDHIGDGNAFQCELIEPATERLLDVRTGDVILDIASGSGRFARRMAELGAQVVAFDFSERAIARARRRTDHRANIEYHVIDARESDQVLALGLKRFDAAVATMALMDMAAIEPLMSALRRCLKPEGRLIFSVMHPCFQPGEIHKLAEAVQADGKLGTRCGVKVFNYLTPAASKGVGIIGQPEPQFYFHRPLQVLFGAGFREGFVIDRLEEPAFPKERANPGGLQWRDMPEIPPILIVRMRLPEQREAS